MSNIVEMRGKKVLEKDELIYSKTSATLYEKQKEAVKHWYDSQYGSLEQMMLECDIPEKTRKYIMEKCPKNSSSKHLVPVYKNLVQMLIKHKDIEDYDITDLEKIQLVLLKKEYGQERRLFGKILKEVGLKNKITSVEYVNPKRKHVDNAMSTEDYVNLAILTFNPKYTKELIRKTLQSKSKANLWLIIASLFICAHRLSDIRNIPLPGIIGNVEELERLLNRGELPAAEAEKYVVLVEKHYEHIGSDPEKTSEQKPDNLRFTVPLEFRQIYGTILAINALHYYDDPSKDPIKKFESINYRQLEGLFGEDIKKLHGGIPHSLATRSITKKYMQELANISETAYSSRLFYLIPGLARSHKSTIGSMAESTWYYLDAKMDDLNIDEIMLEIMKRGVGSSQLIKVLQQGAGDEYNKLDVKSQTKAIQQLRAVADAYDVEVISQMSLELQRQIEADEKQLLELVQKDKKQAMFFVNKLCAGIASGAIVGKEKHCYCTRKMCGYPCRYPERSNCIDCGHEVYTHQYFTRLCQNRNDLKEKVKESSPEIKRRAKAIIDNIYDPAIMLLLKAIKESGGPFEIYLKMVNEKNMLGEEKGEVKKIG